MKDRIVFLDYMRVIACFMVIMVHSCEFFFIDGSEIGIRSMADGWWVSVVDSALRCSVPLFVMISSYLLVPLRGSTSLFLQKRLVRVVIPFAIWSVLYAVLPCAWGADDGHGVLRSIVRLATNFNDSSGHMWFVYMLVGLYLFMPVISPWLSRTGRRGQAAFLLLWVLSTFFPYLRAACGDIYGECYWNEFNTLFYFSGFLGYLVLAHYLRHHLRWTRRRMIATGTVCYLIGYAITATIWYGRIPTATTLQELELSWRFCTPNVVLESFGAFILIQALAGGCRPRPVITCMSRLSYGVYLMHIFVLGGVYALLGGRLSTPLTILTLAILTFALCFLLARLLSWLPRSRYLIG